jgi:hypothetical protein
MMHGPDAAGKDISVLDRDTVLQLNEIHPRTCMQRLGVALLCNCLQLTSTSALLLRNGWKQLSPADDIVKWFLDYESPRNGQISCS